MPHDQFCVESEEGFALHADDLVEQARQHDAVIFVNPNSPTGVYCEEMKDIVCRIQDDSTSPTRCKMIWVDETYIDYIEDAQSLESLTETIPNLLVCKSMSKCYALSGLRVAYAVSQKIKYLRRFIPPWAVSLPGQLAAVAALKNPEYYRQQYNIIHQEREQLSELLRNEQFEVLPGVANFVLTFLPVDSATPRIRSSKPVKKKASLSEMRKTWVLRSAITPFDLLSVHMLKIKK